MNPVARRVAPFLLVALLWGIDVAATMAAELRAGAAKVDITHPDGPVSGPLFSKALVLSDGEKTVALVSLDVVAIGEIGYIKNDFLPKLRQRIETELKIPPQNVLVNASLRQCEEELRAIIAAERLRRDRRPELMDLVRRLNAEFEERLT